MKMHQTLYCLALWLSNAYMVLRCFWKHRSEATETNDFCSDLLYNTTRLEDRSVTTRT